MTRSVLAVLLVVVMIALANSVYVVNETEQVIITQFGEPIGDPIVTPGLKFKVPFIQDVHRFDKRFLEWEGNVAELPTKDKVFILVDTYARWKIVDPLLFFQRVRNEAGAQSRLDDILDGETRNAIAKHNLIEVIRSSNRTPDQTGIDPALETELQEISFGREMIRQEILVAAKARTEGSDLGIEILDVQFKRINYGESVQKDVHNRMISERRRISDRFRSEGEGERARILGDMERELKRIQSEAFREAEEIRGRADAEAAEIYAKAYDRSADSRRFYEFVKSMETLSTAVDDQTSVLLSTEGELFKYFKESGQ